MAEIIDSSVFIQMERRGLDLAVLPMLSSPGEEGLLAAITVSELLVGAYRADTPARRQRKEAFLDAVLEVIPVLAFDRLAARVHARLWAEVAAVGQKIGANDLLIAATALAYDCAVLTDNLREFERVPGLEVRRPQWPRG